MSSVFDSTLYVAEDLGVPHSKVAAATKLLSEGATVPFIARYRKEATGGLDEVALRAIEEKRTYYEELEERRRTVLGEIEKQGQLSDALRATIAKCRSKTELEDLYLPYKPKRRTRATIARERGLEPLADSIWSQSAAAIEQVVAQFVSPEREVQDVESALAGARDIVAERIAELPDVRQRYRSAYLRESIIRVRKQTEFRDQRTKFDDYSEYEEPVSKIPSHRFLAIRRGESEGVLRATLELDWENLLPFVLGCTPYRRQSPWAPQLEQAAKDGVKRLVLSSVQGDVRVELKLRSDQAAIDVFAQNLRELLLAAPLGARAVLGIDPGQRTGCKCAIVDETGKLLAHTTFNLVQGDSAKERARTIVRDLCRRYPVHAVAVGNGTHGRETEAFVRELLREEGLTDETFSVLVSESGASIYSASDVAREEFPELDLTVRGAISIARRLQDPLAELVKIDPKSIGVGQYQHDVSQSQLGRKLDEVVESCVNQVGVELNTASAPLLARVSGISPSLAKKIVKHRDEHGSFRTRQQLLAVSGLGPRTFEQAAGFLRIRSGAEPLDASAVHPERYALVERMAHDLGVPVASLIGNRDLLSRIDRHRYRGGDVGDFTLDDILKELEKPGRDPRAAFEPPRFRDDVRSIEDLRPGMVLEGVVTNVTAFGAFVDVGVHQDGLVHVSQLADRFVKSPTEVVKVGERLVVRVLEIDLERRRISLSARQSAGDNNPPPRVIPRGEDTRTAAMKSKDRRPSPPGGGQPTFKNNPFASHFKK